MENGVVRIHPLDGKNDLEHLSSYWALNVHDNQHGAVRHIKTSFDDKYVFTAGMDGNFFVFKFMDEAVKGLKVPHKVSIPSPKVRLGSLSNVHGKGNEYGKKHNRFSLAKEQLARAFLYISLPARLRPENA